MKKKVIRMILIVLLIGLFLPGCVSKAELEECQVRIVELEGENAELEGQNAELQAENAELEGQNAELQAENAELEGQNAELQAENAELEGQNAELQAEVEYLREPLSEKVRGETAGYISFKKTFEVEQKFFPQAGVRTAGSSRHDYVLNTIETLEQFLVKDPTNEFPSCRSNTYDVGDGWAFQLKDHWIKAGLSAWSLGLAKVEVDTQYGRVLVWRNVFLTQEDGEFVFYEVNPLTDEITKIENEEQSEGYRSVVISSRLWLID
jgi:cell division protein FtsB